VLDLHRLRLLRELQRRGTITAVAEALSFSPSAVSQQLATLERETGVRLLEPFGRRVRLTPQGELLVTHADVLLSEMERAESALARSLDDTTGTLRVAAFQSAVMALVPAALTHVLADHPRLRVEVTELEPEAALPAMIAGELDLVVAEEYPGQPLPLVPGVERTALLDDELLLVTPQAWRARALSDLAERPFVMEPPGTPARRWAVAACRQAGFEPDVRYTTADLKIHQRLVEERLAVALLPALSGVREGALRVAPLPGRPTRTLFVAVRRATSERPAVRAFADALRDGQISADAGAPPRRDGAHRPGRRRRHGAEAPAGPPHGERPAPLSALGDARALPTALGRARAPAEHHLTARPSGYTL
jgi:DNA-binding transcriptional LysR family regulator